MDKVEIIEWVPTPEVRWYAPTPESLPKWQRLFDCKASDGSTGKIWADVHLHSPFSRVVETPNAKVEADGAAYCAGRACNDGLANS